MEIINNTNRNGNFTSSGISALFSTGKQELGFGVGAITYINEKNMERKLGRSLNTEISARPTTWGNHVEEIAFQELGLEYNLTSKKSYTHPFISYWSGSPDGIKEETVYDIKCPFTLKSFCTFADCKDIQEIRDKHKQGEDYYWQLVSGAILTKSKFAELVVFCPYKSQLDSIRDAAANFDGNQNKIAWIGFSQDEDLPYLIDGGYYKNLYKFHFEVPESDIKLLTEKVELAGKLLIPTVY